MTTPVPTPQQRRSFLTRLHTGMASLAVATLGGATVLSAKTKEAPRWEPARHEQDDWFDKIPGKHRLLIDTTTYQGFGEGLAFGGNFLNVNRMSYGLQNSDMAVVLVARHFSTPFAYNDAMWMKYGATMANMAGFEDPQTKQPPTVNVYLRADHPGSNLGTTIDSLTTQGVQLAVCALATRALAGFIARATGGDAEAVNKELIANLLPNSHMVPAGIVAVSRAQERGYTMAKA